MEKLLNKVLIVVDPNGKNGEVLRNIIPLCNELQCDIHLLHVVKSPLPVLAGGAGHALARKFDQLVEQTRRLADKGRQIQSHSLHGNIEKAVWNFTMLHPIDLVILMQHRKYPWSRLLGRVNINRLARKINCPVLNLPSGNIRQIRKIVLPVTNVLPLRKMMFASYLARFHNASIHLVALREGKQATEQERHHYLLKSYQLLRDNTNLRIECHPVSGHNIANTTLEYAEKVDADLIVVQAGREVELPGFMNNIFSRFLFSASPIPVMAV